MNLRQMIFLVITAIISVNQVFADELETVIPDESETEFVFEEPIYEADEPETTLNEEQDNLIDDELDDEKSIFAELEKDVLGYSGANLYMSNQLSIVPMNENLVSLGDKNIGDIIKITVDGLARDFIVIHKGRPSTEYGLAFIDTVTVMQQDVEPNRVWHSPNNNDYQNSSLHSWLNGEYFNSIDANIRNQIVQVRIPYRPGSGTSTMVSSGESGLQCRVFLLSMTEVGYDTLNSQYMVTEGVRLSYFLMGDGADALNRRIAYRSGSTAIWWLRSPDTRNSTAAWLIHRNGFAYNNVDTSLVDYGLRPVFVLPAALLVEVDGSVITDQPPVSPDYTEVVNLVSEIVILMARFNEWITILNAIAILFITAIIAVFTCFIFYRVIRIFM